MDREESYIELKKKIRSLASFYSKAGPSAPLPEEIKNEMLNDLNTAEECLSNMATISATSSITLAAVASRPSPSLASPAATGLPRMAKKGKVMCSMEKKPCAEEKGSAMGMSAPLLAAACAATMSSPQAMALVDERMSTEGIGLPFGLSNNLLGWILFGVFGLIWALYFVYTSSLKRMRSPDCPSKVWTVERGFGCSIL
ncbi:Photosystem II reaction center W protein [Hibiscus syriacus]|uniref:PSII 6.1 kDa protein n=1 Tax=Hibiscus syriacus TaxID=106335 RepID=A0A6A2YZX0_HIBSY|nr:Photosystem II reaction center W protein [Hibiscus syriacus]